jgi:hypothetical protein
MSRTFGLALIASLAFASVARADDTAALAYRQAEDLAKQGKWEEACPLYDASYRADPQIGVLLHLADCHEHVGRVASAWAEFNDAVELAHRRGDNREALAQGRADALKPKLAYLHLAPPAKPAPGLSVQRDGLDVTVLVGTDMPIDPGDHEIVATAPGFIEWRKKLTIGTLPTTTPLAIPDLEKQVVPQPVVEPPKVHEGSVKITSQPDAHITIDSIEVGTAGSYQGKVKSGGHQLRVTAPGMRAYQTEIFVADDAQRNIDVTLEKEMPTYVPPPPEDLPSFEVGLAFAPGVKGHGDDPAVLSYRADIGLRLGRRINLGVFAEFASVSANKSCGTDLPGPIPETPFDYGLHYKFNSCFYGMAGLQMYIHLRPKQQVDPYLGFSPGFRFGSINTTPYEGGVATGMSTSQFLPGIAVGSRFGIDYHPYPKVPGFGIGGFLDLQTMIIGDENIDNMNGSKGKTYASFFAGIRSSYAF